MSLLLIATLPGLATGCGPAAGGGFSGGGGLDGMTGMQAVADVNKPIAISNSPADFADSHLMFIIYTVAL